MALLKRLLICLLLPMTFVQANDLVGNAVAVIGTVSVVRAETGSQETLTMNGELYLNDVIQTGADGLVKLLLRDESILKVSPNSELLISEMIAGPGEGGRSTVDLLKGRIRSVIGNKLGANSEFNVNTPVAVAGVRGTDFEVIHTLVDGEWVTGVRCFDGAVALSTIDLLSSISNTLILPNQYSLASSSQLPTVPQDMPEGSSLFDILGIEDSAASFDLLGDASDVSLDVAQVQAVLLNLDNDLDIDIDRVIARVIEDYQTNLQIEEPTNDVQLETITEPVVEGAELNFEIEIPLPN